MDKRLTECTEHTNTYKDSITSLEDKIFDLSHFGIEGNEGALTYFEQNGYDVVKLIPFIKDELYKLNEPKGEHPLVPYAAGEGRKMMINSVKLLNHKWIIADFSDGVFWGEMLVKYEMTEEGVLKFNLIDSFLYPLE